MSGLQMKFSTHHPPPCVALVGTGQRKTQDGRKQNGRSPWQVLRKLSGKLIAKKFVTPRKC